MECKGCVLYIMRSLSSMTFYRNWIKTAAGYKKKKKILPGLGYESGGYVPFLTESLSIHAKAASVTSSDAVHPKSMLYLMMTE